ncbi:hypothetical protein A3B02_01890 [Candidatus Roizmanbacteria bacterium RIFCSPLOWO2_01_FULL_42_14]|uniref:Uncharacterized protein n=4 Tax=Candidatus Roizmaniibacteriota TaxID=1752723 RepID=A0A1F7JUY1_9BACT|nr:MAG: hypothetical protein A3D08_02415 [Candidatus Roizmanbacteria bacterium RIFCSPHIGHO2_02_FULL_43_11]OGK38382.1 MAG: hypothetical protein A3F32_00170 [Candidatus Roizmanbacteria bacterium RIFCSPHIGHO2_12_FULL_42_10]OGK52471.1 MAG: hypothetical protein A3B02_01890 [Candidatus Roizmanbacteria bacterium RIFCSPLOWO2_01_FULL_42_14]OGK59404.1 MAG: hypothetical protein A3I56_01880 [Candidatus Roizmanbacteria bacterium RIFCSPLOWO2_02_FULL_43_10]
MLDSSQILIIAAITIMTAILTVIGVQLILVLKDIKKILGRVNALIDAIEGIGFSITHGSAEIIGFITGVKKLLGIVDAIAEKSKRKKHGTSK